MASRPRHDDLADPQEALGRWIAQRQAAKGEYKKILNERENELIEANARFGPHSSPHKSAKEELEEAELQRQEIHGVIRRPLNRFQLRLRTFILFAAVLAVLEGSVNKILFDVALQSIGFVSYATSFVIAFCIVILAHLAGRSLRQIWSEYRGRPVWSSIFVFLAISFVLVSIVGILTVGRAMTSANAAIANFQDMFAAATSSVSRLGLFGTLAAAVTDLSALVLATVNFAGIFAALMLAYFTHDPDKDYDAAANKVERHRDELSDLDRKFTDAKTRVVRKFSSHITAVSTRYKMANKQVMLLKQRVGVPLDAEDAFLIDDMDQLAETSEVGDVAEHGPEPSADSQPARPARLSAVETQAPAARRA